MMLLLALAGMAAILGTRTNTAQAAGVNQGELVPETPRINLPVALDGRALAHAQVGDRIFVGGDFTQVQLPDGTVLDQPYIYAYDIDTGELDPNFLPVLNNDVRSLEASADGTGLYVGGRFIRWEADGATNFPVRLARLDAQGRFDSNFSAPTSAQVISLESVGNDLYVGGDFFDINGTAVTGLAKVDGTSGAVDQSFDFELGPSIAGTSLVRRVVASPDGDYLFALHYGQRINDEIRRAVAKIDISGDVATLSGWTVPWLEQTNDSLCWSELRDMAISPDGSFIVIGGQGADNPPNCDSVLKYETAGEGVVNFSWSARMYSSVFSLAVSDVAVYAGGHFCAAPRNPIPPGGISSDFAGTANLCVFAEGGDPRNPSERDPENAVFRNQMAALDPVTGQALEWDPGSDNFVAVWDLTLIERGLLAGHDSGRFNDVLVGRSGFFDLGGEADTEAPVVTVSQPVAGSVVTDLAAIAGTATDNRNVSAIEIQLRNITTGLWLRNTGEFAENPVDLIVDVTETGLGEIAWSVDLPPDLPSGEYSIRGFASDPTGATSPGLDVRFTVPGASQCSVALDADDQPVITYSGFQADGVDTVFLRRDAGFLSNIPANAGSFTDTTATPGDYSYLIRWRLDGVVTDVPCTPASITVPVGGGGLTCTVAINADNDPLVSWTEIAGVNNYVVREAGLGFVQTVQAPNTSYVDVGRAPGDYSYVLRYRQNGNSIDLPCSPAPITVPEGPVVGNTCTATVNANDRVVLSWTPIAGEDTYIVRDNDGFVENVGNVLTYVDDAPAAGDRTYVIRSRQAGVTTDVTCNLSLIHI